MGDKHKSSLLKRVVEAVGDDSIIERLVNLRANDLQILLLHILDERVHRTSPKDALRKYRQNVYCGVSELSQRELAAFTEMFHTVAEGRFEPVELAPVSPLGTNGVMTELSQNNILSATRNLEVVGDPTTVLALEAASRRQDALHQGTSTDGGSGSSPVHLSTDHRILRLQRFDPSLGYMQHFRCIGMVSADRKQKDFSGQCEAILRHIQVYLDFVTELQNQGYVLNDVCVLFSDLRMTEKLIEACGVSRELLTRRTQDYEFDPWDVLAIDVPRVVSNPSEIPVREQKAYGLQHIVGSMERVQQSIVDPLHKSNPGITFGYDLARIAGLGYYLDTSFHIFATNARGLRLQLADGGFTDWTATMLSDKAEFCFTSGFGSELVHKMFRA